VADGASARQTRLAKAAQAVGGPGPDTRSGGGGACGGCGGAPGGGAPGAGGKTGGSSFALLSVQSSVTLETCSGGFTRSAACSRSVELSGGVLTPPIAASKAVTYRVPMNRILLVCGSLQRSSANRAALDVARTALSASGVEVSAFGGLESIPPLNPDRADDPDEAVLAFRAEIRAADAVLIAAPEYAGAVAGLVKNALDWVVGSGDLYAIASLGIESANARSVSDSEGTRRITDPKTLDEIAVLASSLLASVAQSPSERFADITRLTRDAAVELGPLANHISSQQETWLRERNVG
jgi:chromate reductase